MQGDDYRICSCKRTRVIVPQLRNPYDISLQDILNENQADYRSQQRMIGNNPAAQSMLNAQKYAANQKVLGEQFRLNQANKDPVYRDWETDRKSTRLNSSHSAKSRMPSSA